MKQTHFRWAWGDHEAQVDESMTRERAACLLRAWRRSRTQGQRDFALTCVRRQGTRFYCVRTTKYINDDAGILVVPVMRALPRSMSQIGGASA